MVENKITKEAEERINVDLDVMNLLTKRIDKDDCYLYLRGDENDCFITMAGESELLINSLVSMMLRYNDLYRMLHKSVSLCQKSLKKS